ncbi:MAG: SGNH/GDSL hydrolase family protein [Desulfobaccales bacterium]
MAMRAQPRCKFNNVIKNIVALVCSLIIVFLLVELILHLWEPFEFRVKGDKIVLPINRNYVFKNDKIPGLDDVIVHSKNRLGFRGDNPPQNFADYLTIISVGGSTTECFYLSDNKTWPDILGRELKRDFKKIWINNAGLDGCSSFAHLMLLKDYIIKIKPKVVLFLVGSNDVWLEDSRTYDDEIIKDPSSAVEKILQKSEIYNLGLNLFRYWKAKKMKVGHTHVDLRKVEHIDIPEEQIISLTELHKGRYIKSYEERLSLLIEICKKNSIMPVLITQPSLLGKGVDVSTGVNLETVKIDKGLNGKEYWRLLELYNDTTRKAATMHRAWLIDLAKEMPKNSQYFYDNQHFTNAGAQKVAEIIYQELSPLLAIKFNEYKVDRN